jgi:hypothetical protein
MNVWYELELIVQNEVIVEAIDFYKNEYNRPDSNAGFDLHLPGTRFL